MPANLLLHLISISIYVSSRRVLIQSSSSSRARSKVMNQTLVRFDVPDPLVGHVLLLTHELYV